jgi:hypothetical protein
MTILLWTLFGVGGYHFGRGVGKMILENKNQNKDE